MPSLALLPTPTPTPTADQLMTFKEAVEQTPHLENAYCVGLQALRAEDKPHIEAEDTRKLTGSVDVDTANLATDPNGNRWDFGIAYQHTNRNAEVVYWIELHTASDSEIKVVIKKAQWLLNWFKGSGKILAAFEKDIVWVSSGATTFTLSSPQKKQMAQAGLQHVGSKLYIRKKR
jgi:hypothetical protein